MLMKMNTIIFICTVFSFTVRAIENDDSQAQIIKYENFNDGSGNYRFSYETSNGILRTEEGQLLKTDKEDEHVVVHGSFSYTDPDGKYVLVKYKSDENGYQLIQQATPQQQGTVFSYGVPPAVLATLVG